MSFAGGAEIAFIALLAFVIIGPKDLPKVLFTLGRFLRTLQTLAQQFTSEFEAIHHVRELEEKHKISRKKSSKK